MVRSTRALPILVLSAVLACPLAGYGCSQQQPAAGGENAQQAEQSGQEEQSGQATKTEQANQQPAATQERQDDGRIDVKKEAPKVATFFGTKLIASDATNTQQGAQSPNTDYGLQEVCVIMQPEYWTQIDSIGWARNSVSYGRIAMPWGKLSYTFEYVNEANVEGLDAEISQTTPEAYFGNMQDVQTLQTDGRTVYFANDDAPSINGRFTIRDLEAPYYGDGRDTSHDVGIHAYEQRADKCAFTIAIKCQVDEGQQIDETDQELVADALKIVSFGTQEAANAASYESDVAITSADKSQSVVIKRNGSNLEGFAEHVVRIVEAPASEEDWGSYIQYDYAFEGDVASYEGISAEVGEYTPDNGYQSVEVSDFADYDLDELKAHARVVTAEQSMGDVVQTVRELRACVEAPNNKLLVVTASVREGESEQDALKRAVAGRVNFQPVTEEPVAP